MTTCHLSLFIRGTEYGKEIMTDHVLTEDEVDERERLYQNLPSIHHNIDAIFSSHRLQAARIQELEKGIMALKGLEDEIRKIRALRDLHRPGALNVE